MQRLTIKKFNNPRQKKVSSPEEILHKPLFLDSIRILCKYEAYFDPIGEIDLVLQ